MNADVRFIDALAQNDPRAPKARAALLGVPYDGAVSYRAGARFGPIELRKASDSIETYCPKLERDLEDHTYLDLGDLDVTPSLETPGATAGERFCNHVSRQLDDLPALPTLTIGGDHLIAYPFLARALARYPDLQIIHLDAHLDMRAQWDGDPYNHATVLGRAVDRMGPAQTGVGLWQWGIRSGLREEFNAAREDPRIHALTDESAVETVTRLLNEGKPLYLTFDLDGLDPAVIPGTGTPEADGLSFAQAEALIGTLAQADRGGGPGLIGADLVELAPNLDPSGRSQVAAARLARGLLLALLA